MLLLRQSVRVGARHPLPCVRWLSLAPVQLSRVARRSRASILATENKEIPQDVREVINGTVLEKANNLKDLYRYLYSSVPPVNYADYVTTRAIKEELRYLYPNPLKVRAMDPPVKRIPIDQLPENCIELDPYFRPKSSAHFTGNPKYYDTLTELELLVTKLNSIQKEGTFEVDPSAQTVMKPRWVSHKDLQSNIGEAFKTKMYENLVTLFNTLYIHPLYPQLGNNVLKKYTRSVEEVTERKSVASIDEQGRAHSVGKRKSSVARVWVWKQENGEASFRVNGKPLALYFKDHERVLEASSSLRFLDVSGSYSVKCYVHGGGVTGQAAAIALAISKSLVTLSPDVYDDLNNNEFLVRDSRTVEPKKAGQKKARKKFQWVKR
eukprot:m.23678 g.23678  ORF g.23678 m.23678 type:complete len:379 (-) comp5572_c0_seq1:154-1290(-)